MEIHASISGTAPSATVLHIFTVRTDAQVRSAIVEAVVILVVDLLTFMRAENDAVHRFLNLAALWWIYCSLDVTLLRAPKLSLEEWDILRIDDCHGTSRKADEAVVTAFTYCCIPERLH